MKLPRVTTTYSGIKNKPFMLTKDINFTLSNGDNMFIKKGYITDFASLPRLLKIFFDYLGDDGESFVIHDFLYHYRHYVTDKGLEPIYVDRKFADKEMRWQMKTYGSNWLRRTLFYAGVRVGGMFRYGKI